MVRCPNCQHESSGRFFCERCHQLLPVTLQPPVPETVTLPDGHAIDCSGWRGVWPADAWTPRDAAWGPHPCRVYALNRGWWRDLAAAVVRRSATRLDALPPVAVVPVGDAAVVVARGLAGAVPVLLEPDPPDADALDRLDATVAACGLLERALTPLHEAGFVWLDFAPAGLEAAGGLLALRSLDLNLFPAGAVPANLRHSPAYSSPEVCGFAAEAVGPATDVFHLSLFAYYRLAGLLPGGMPGEGLESFDFAFPELRIFRPDLPPGVARVLDRGLMRDPRDRFATVAELCGELRDAAARARRRSASRSPVRVEAAAATTIGAMHVHIGLPNQDACAVASLGPDALLVVVADGVSHATVGSGDRASAVALDTLAGRLPALLGGGADPREALALAFLDSSRAVLADALTELPAADVDPTDLMSSTALVGLVRGNELTVGSVGDSRAYLVADGYAEQLTVDGDVRCLELRRGVPPEQVERLGAEAHALYTCLGVAERDAGGRLVASLGRARPTVTQWRLLPGDVVLLCTDGLAEQGVFLGPADLARIVAQGRGGPAAELARSLVRAADDCQRPPSEWEPYGCGDDITCVVLVVR